MPRFGPRDLCPRCGSDAIHGARFTVEHGQVHERHCRACGLGESRLSSDADLGEWLARWTAAAAPKKDPEGGP